ncbi:egg cell-secreted protein 1.1-like [Salvia splendens]|uniref:egg cell-secreted protein 1.1-like n=1 Tax=Salvia splendens TaxID=180675 RepID=UPI001C27C150|nr:egg cell-secreted protein 1.1-like [Salvia splendens]
MAFPTKLVAALMVAMLASPLMISARNLESRSRSSLAARLKVAEEVPSTCWDALLELQSCSGEMVMFFLNGETQLGENCCSAVKVIERQCWPSMLGTLGITAEESNVLRGYCDAAAAGPPPASTLEKCYNFPRLQH